MRKVLVVLTFLEACILTYAQPTVVNIHLDSGGKDAVVTNAVPLGTYGTAGQFNVYWSGSVYRTFLQADFTSIPTNAIVLNAKLKLTATANDFSAAQSLELCRSNSSWVENAICWNNQPTFTGTGAAVFTTPNTTGLHTLTHSYLITHVQHMVTYPALNYGWCLKMATESGSSRGLTYKSKEAAATLPVSRPYLEITYILPIEVTGTVTHCSEGHDDGAITNIVATEGTESYTNYAWYKYEMGTVTSIGSGASLTSMTGLSDGLYLVQVTDNGSFTGYKYFLIGEENTNTTVEFSNTNSGNSTAFNEDALIEIVSGSGITPNGSSVNIKTARVSTGYTYSLLSYKVDFDSRLFFESANLTLYGVSSGHTRTSPGSNETKLYRVVNPWVESTVTWFTKPGVNTSTPTAAVINSTSSGTTTVSSTTLNVLGFVNYWSANPTANYGFRFDSDTTANATQQMNYYSYDYSSSGSRPKLVLTYTLSEPTNYYGLSETQEGSFYRVTDDLLRIKYMEEYMDLDGQLTYQIKNAAGTVVMDQTDEAQLITHGDNRLRIDISSLSAGFYTFELSNEKEEKWYLRFEQI